jgi:hypothetical protein
MNRAITCAAYLLLFATAARARPLQAYQKSVRQLDKRERAYFKEFRKRFTKAWDARYKVLRAYHHHKSDEIDTVNDSARALWEKLASIERERAEAARTLAQSGDPAALGRLFKEFLAALTAAEELDTAVLFEKSRAWHYLNDQAPAYRRAGLHMRVQGYGAALRLAQGAQDFLPATGWNQAVAKDKRGSVVRRVALIDLLDAAQPLVRTQLRAVEFPLRIVAAERMVGTGPDGVAVVLADENPIVRRALLQEVRRQAAKDARWIAPVLSRYPQAAGGERYEALRTLRALTGEAIGDDPAAWKAWYEAHRVDIEAGRFQRQARKSGTAATVNTPRFYGIPIENRGGIIFLCEWGYAVMSPCDNDFQRTKMFVDWFGMDMSKFPEWERKYPSRKRVFLRQFQAVVSMFPEESRVGLVLLADGATNDYPKFRPRANVAPVTLDKKGRRTFEKTFKSVVPGWSRWQAPYSGLLIAMQLAGLDPARVKEPVRIAADTFVLVSDGLIKGSRYLLPEHTIEDFERRNRFRRVRVHTVHVGTEGRESQRLLEGLANASDGTYVRITKTPRAP